MNEPVEYVVSHERTLIFPDPEKHPDLIAFCQELAQEKYRAKLSPPVTHRLLLATLRAFQPRRLKR